MELEISGGGGDTNTPLNMEKRLASIVRYVSPSMSVLDIGCGRGEYVLAVSAFAQARGIETDEDKVNDFRIKHPNLHNLVDVGSAESLPYPSESFDVVIVNEVLEHIPDQQQALDEIYRVLKPAGRFLLFCPNRLYPFESHGMIKRDGTHSNPWIPFIPYIPLACLPLLGLKPWARNYWPGEVRRLLKSHGFHLLTTCYVVQTFENISGAQPGKLTQWRPALRRMFSLFERIPGVRAFVSVSQFLVCTKQAIAKE